MIDFSISVGDDGEEVVFVSSNGLVSRTLVSSIAVQSRSAKGVNILNLKVPRTVC